MAPGAVAPGTAWVYTGSPKLSGDDVSTSPTEAMRPADAPAASPGATPPSPKAPAPAARLRTVMAGALLAMVLAALDQNIVNTALPRMVGDLGGMAHPSWVVPPAPLQSANKLYPPHSVVVGRV